MENVTKNQNKKPDLFFLKEIREIRILTKEEAEKAYSFAFLGNFIKQEENNK